MFSFAIAEATARLEVTVDITGPSSVFSRGIAIDFIAPMLAFGDVRIVTTFYCSCGLADCACSIFNICVVKSKVSSMFHSFYYNS